MNVFSIKNFANHGIRYLRVSETVCAGTVEDSDGRIYLRGEWHLSFRDALAEAEKRRDRQIEALESEIKKLRNVRLENPVKNISDILQDGCGMILKYERNKYESLTCCSYRKNEGIYIGSIMCKECGYFIEDDEDNRIVKCSAPHLSNQLEFWPDFGQPEF